MAAAPAGGLSGARERDAGSGRPRWAGGRGAYSRITQVAVHLPAGRQSAQAVEETLREHSPSLRVPAGLVRRLFGLEERLVAPEGELPSDLAARAVDLLLDRAGVEPGQIDLLLFAAVSADVQEPANGHVVAAKTGLTCPVFDISNACNSVLNALEVADAFIRGGRYRRIVIACGELGTRFSRWSLSSQDDLRTAIASVTGGDMGAALLVEASTEPGITASVFLANSQGWPAATLFNPHQVQNKPLGLHIDPARLLASFHDLDIQAGQWLKEQGVNPNELGLVCVHQPSVPFVRTFCERMGIDVNTVVPTFAHTGNVSAATLPLQLARALDEGRLRRGTRVALFGLASGASVGVMLIDW
ncbi:hypothetical protein DVK44_18070 [Streptomyces paludis]|uniref:Ketoacyl-ACP synthase III n=2 Tax=Streptomyces paludis TaxID=2282738 RepID=A0A345I180_9ACTN|nr:hypothetical protein DVK44_18070 [Streptomyces paludis]